MTSEFFHSQPTLKRLFNNFVGLYWCRVILTRNHVNIIHQCKLSANWDTFIGNFDKCSDIFDKFSLPFRTLSFRISGDKIQNVFWRVSDMTLPASVEYAIIYCGTYNLGHNSPLKIAEKSVKREMVHQSPQLAKSKSHVNHYSK